MAKRLAILFLMFFVIFILTCLGLAEPRRTKKGNGEAPARQDLLRDGFALSGIDGKVSNTDGDESRPSTDELEEWFFELDSDVTDHRTVVKKGTSLQLLPSATLQRITDDMEIRSAANYCLWGRVTKYKGKNFIFPIYFLPLSKIEQPQTETPRTPEEPNQQERKQPETTNMEKDDWEPNINDPNDILAVPQEIIDKLKTRRLELAKWQDTDTSRETEPNIQPASIEKAGRTPRQDAVLANRTAFLIVQDDDRPIFVLDALGRSAPKISLRLLPCEALELTEQRQSAELEQPRFKIAGIMTKYKDQNYLLLQRAAKVYSHDNFAR